MKNVVLAFMLTVLMVGCKRKEEEVGPFGFLKGNLDGANFASSSGFPLGKYRLLYYHTGSTVPYEVNFEINPKDIDAGEYTISGKSCINFYFANVAVGSSVNEVEFSELISTTINGEEAKEKFEKDYFKKMLSVKSYEYREEGQNLILYTSEDFKAYLVFALESN